MPIQRNQLWASVQGGNWSANQVSAITVILITVLILFCETTFICLCCLGTYSVGINYISLQIPNIKMPRNITSFAYKYSDVSLATEHDCKDTQVMSIQTKWQQLAVFFMFFMH